MANHEDAVATRVVIDGKNRALTTDEIVEAFTRRDGARILDYQIVTHGWVRPRIRRIELTVTFAD